MQITSQLVDQVVNNFMNLPGVGQKTALRYVLHLLKQDKNVLLNMSKDLTTMAQDLQYCQQCYNISDTHICGICANALRDKHTICVVEDIRDVMAIEDTHQYRGVYHVLGGLISPMEGIAPSDLQIQSLEKRVQSQEIQEVIFALSGTMEGETTVFYIHKKIKNSVPKISAIARGVAFGGDLEYVDEVTLGRSILGRVPYEV